MTRKLLPLLCLLATARGALGQELTPQDILGQDRELSVQQAVTLGLQYNLALQIIRNDPAIARERLREAEGLWNPNLIGTYDRNHFEVPSAGSLQALFGLTGNRTVDNSNIYNGGLQGVLPWGLSYSTGYLFRDLRSSSGVYSFKPQYNSDWSTSLTVPLLRGLYWGPVDLLVRRGEVGQALSDATFASRLADGVFLVESYYWNLSATRALERATGRAVNTAQDLLEQTKVQYQVGTVSKVLVTQAEAGVAQRESQHITAEAAAKRAQDDLLTVILEPGINDYSNTTIRTEEPSFVDYPVNPDESLAKAHANRTELLESQLVVEDAELQEKYAWNAKLPQLDVQGTYTNSGLSGTQKRPAGILAPSSFATAGPTSVPVGPNGVPLPTDPTDPNFRPPAEGDFLNNAAVPFVRSSDFGFGSSAGASTDGFFDGNGFHSYTLAITFSYPIGNETADARYTQRRIDLRRARTQQRRTEQDVIVNVRSAVRDLQSSIDRVKAAQRARIASEETLRAEEERLRLGDSTPHNVLEFQDDLLQAEASEISALQSYRTSIAALERAQGTLLESKGISVVNERDRGMDQY